MREEVAKLRENEEEEEPITQAMKRACEIPRKIVPVKDWMCRPAELYEKLNIVGKGTFGYFLDPKKLNRNVFKARIKAAHSRTGKDELVALKQINQSFEKDGFPITALREVVLLSRLKQKNILDLIEVVTSKRTSPDYSLVSRSYGTQQVRQRISCFRVHGSRLARDN